MHHRWIAWTLATMFALAACTNAATVPSPPDKSVTGAVSLLLEAPDGLPAGVVEGVLALPGVRAASLVRSDTLGMVATRSDDGTTIQQLNPPWRIPVTAMAIDPTPAAATLPQGSTRIAVRALRPGQTLVPTTSAELRDLAAGDIVELRSGARLVVAAIIADSAFAGHDLIVHQADAQKLGLDRTGKVLLATDGTQAASFVDDLEAVAPRGSAVRVVGARSGQPRQPTAAVLSLPQLKQRFGEFAYRDDTPGREIYPDPEWVAKFIVRAKVPILGRVRCHRAIIGDLRHALQSVVDLGLADEIDPSAYAGCFYARRIDAGTQSLSRHSWGIALDINVDLSVPGKGAPPDPRIVAAFAQAGFRWGGQFLSPDNHHFEWVGATATIPLPPAGVGEAPSGASL